MRVTRSISGQTRTVRFLVAAGGLALLLISCLDRKANRAAPTNAGGQAIERSSADAVAKAPPVGLTAHWGSALLRFVDSNPQCAALAAITARQLAQVRDPYLSSSPADSTERVAAFRAVITTHTACLPVDGGAWATLFEGGTDPRAWSWFVGFFPNGGATAKHPGYFIDQVDAHAAPATYAGKADLFDGSTYVGPYRLQVLSDYDGNGTPEAVVWTARLGQEVRSAARGVLWSFAHGAVAPFPATDRLGIAPFEVDPSAQAEPAPLSDLDGDGRIDLLGYGPFFGVFKQGCGVIESFDALGPRLALHALADGTFSDSDQVARTYAKRQCPTRPTRILSFGEHGVDQRITFLSLGCARLWNVSPRAVHTEAESACGSSLPSSTDCDAPSKCSAEALAVLALWGKKRAPFSLE